MRLAVIGQGSIGRRHAGLLRELGHDVVTYDPAGPDAAGAPRAGSVGDAVEDADAVLVASPTSLHAEHARAALEAGRPVLVEKPLATTAQAGAEIRRLGAQRGVAVGVAMNLRFHPGPATIRRLVCDGAIGRPLRASVYCGSWLPGWRPDTDYRQAYSARADLGGGVLLDAVHEIDYVTWALGPVARVGAVLRHISDLELAGVEDVAHLDLELARGTQVSVTLDYVDRAYHRGCRIVGSDGTLDWSWTEERVRHVAADGTSDDHPAPADVEATYRAELRQFIEAVADGAAVAVDAADGVHALEVVEASRRAAAEGIVQDVAPDPDGAIELRPATNGDRDRLRAWRNDPVTRAVSFVPEPVAPDDHAHWLCGRLDDPACRLWIAEAGGLPAGQVRVQRRSSAEAEVHIGLSPAARGRGIAAPTLVLAVDRARLELGVEQVTARVRPGNEPSLRAFRRAGFGVVQESGTEIVLRHTPPCTSA